MPCFGLAWRRLILCINSPTRSRSKHVIVRAGMSAFTMWTSPDVRLLQRLVCCYNS